MLVHRTLKFFQQYGPVTLDGFSFEGAYTKEIGAGDGDFLTDDTIWDLKVLKNEITAQNTLQLLIYYLMGKRSIHPEFETINQIGIYNPRYNAVYQLLVKDISQDIIKEVSENVIGYR